SSSVLFFFFFFFSSRRRHTRLQGDWSSDVCSSDLLVSISIDPEEDTPARLREYAQQYAAGPSWQHYTGTAAASVAAQRAFEVYRSEERRVGKECRSRGWGED